MRMRTWVAAGVCAGAVLTQGSAVAAPVPEADLSFHGTVVMNGDQVEVRLTPRNDGPGAIADATVRLRWSVPLVDPQSLPARCLREDERTVLCATGALAAEATGDQLRVPVRLRELPPEVEVRLETAWSGDVVDKDRSNDSLTVLVLATGDTYAF
ncbi:hypothetical protein [Streptomyces sp900105245]|uniref:hypothetical protein n=1 Tax=unclassified Streptomyces TaxID=2593676 RepID=UPI0033227C32